MAFDFARLAECREVTFETQGTPYPDEKIVEVKLRVSVHLIAGNLDDVEEVRIEIRDCDNKIRVHNFEPNTRMESPFSEPIQWTKTTETGKSLGASFGGAVPVPAGTFVAQVTPSLSAGISGREVITEVQQRVAPQRAAVASGTISQEHGVFFKLRSSPQSFLEGVHELTIRFVVPENWRGDSMRVCCRATGHEKILWMKQQTTWAQLTAPVALYLAGDSEARQAALQHIDSGSL
ncbi:MAG: hypothetical protein MK171_00605 [Pirellulales bacterium]|nr:hypothetical protein [Pirellulales bacterium]